MISDLSAGYAVRGRRARRSFLMALGAIASSATLSAQTTKAQKGRAFLQLTLYDRMREKFFKPYFAALDKHYTPLMLKAPGLLLYQRFTHYDLPERVSLELWDSEQAAKSWHDGETARAAWQSVVKDVGPGAGAEYMLPMHSIVHRHYILEESFKS